MAFSHRLILWTSLLAVAYPILAATGQWLFGSPFLFGSTEVIPAAAPFPRIFIFFCISGSVFLYVLAERSKSGWRVPSFVGATLILYAPFFSDVIGISLPQEVAFAFAVAFAGAFAFAVAFAFVLLVTERKIGPRPLLRLLYSTALLIGLAFAIRFSRAEVFDTSQTYFVLTFGLLPLLNGMADFASVGSTRFFLRRSLEETRWAFGQTLWDFAAGLMIFFLLGTGVVAFFGYVRFPNGEALIDLPDFFAGLISQPGDYTWFLVMLLTTLIPTLAHAALGLFAFLFSYPRGLRRAIAARIHNGRKSDLDGLIGTLALSALIAGSIWLTFLIGRIIVSGLHLTEGMIHAFEWIANAIGAM